jgi:ketosteroid isomerase-like protein
VTRLRGRARGSGIEADQRQGFAFFLRDGRIARLEMYPDREDAAQAPERHRT